MPTVLIRRFISEYLLVNFYPVSILYYYFLNIANAYIKYKVIAKRHICFHLYSSLPLLLFSVFAGGNSLRSSEYGAEITGA